MDVFYHSAVGYVVSKVLGGQYTSAAVISAILPDVIDFVPSLYFNFRKSARKHDKNFLLTVRNSFKRPSFANRIDKTVYYTTHSLVFAVILSYATYLFFPPAWPVVLLSYLSHILIDIPTHEGEYSTRILYPFSDIHLIGNNWETHRTLYFAFWGGLIVIYFLLNLNGGAAGLPR